MSVSINPKYSNQTGTTNVDNACQAIETAMQELVANGATAAQIDAVWAAHSNDTNLKTAVKASIASGQRNP